MTRKERVIQGIKTGSGEETLCPIIERVWKADSVQSEASFPVSREKRVGAPHVCVATHMQMYEAGGSELKA